MGGRRRRGRVERRIEARADTVDVEEAREKALDFLENMDDDEHYRSGFVDACVMMDRILTDPEYFGLREDSDDE